MAENRKFSTTDTALASFLYSSGKNLLNTFYEYDPVIFVFEQNGTDFKELEFQWKSGILIGNIPLFFKVYRNFIDEIKKHKQEKLW